MYISICFWAFSSSWKEEKKILYCNLAIVLQERGLKNKNLYCNTIIVLQTRRLGWIVLQHGGKLYAGCCIVLQYRECSG